MSTLIADVEGESYWTEPWKCGDLSRKQTPKTIHFNRPHLGNLAQCNTRFTALYYFHKYNWPNSKPIVCSEPKMFCHLVLVNSHDWSVTLRGGIKVPSEKLETTYKALNESSGYSRLSEGKLCKLCPWTRGPAISTHCWWQHCIKQMSITAQLINIKYNSQLSLTENIIVIFTYATCTGSFFLFRSALI